MKRTSLVISVCVFLMGLGAFPATAGGPGSIAFADSDCASIFVSYNTSVGMLDFGAQITLDVTVVATGALVYQEVYNVEWPFSFYSLGGIFNVPPLPDGTLLRLVTTDTSPSNDTIQIACVAPKVNRPLPIFEGFNPRDGRVEPKPADRVAVYCAGPELKVWGIGPDSVGFPIATFPFADIVNAGRGGISISKPGLGTVSVSVDSQNNFWLAWQGNISVSAGQFYADGTAKNGYAKGFTCAVPK